MGRAIGGQAASRRRLRQGRAARPGPGAGERRHPGGAGGGCAAAARRPGPRCCSPPMWARWPPSPPTPGAPSWACSAPRPPRLVTTGRTVIAGTSGAVSGLGAGAAAAGRALHRRSGLGAGGRGRRSGRGRCRWPGWCWCLAAAGGRAAGCVGQLGAGRDGAGRLLVPHLRQRDRAPGPYLRHAHAPSSRPPVGGQ